MKSLFLSQNFLPNLNECGIILNWKVHKTIQSTNVQIFGPKQDCLHVEIKFAHHLVGKIFLSLW